MKLAIRPDVLALTTPIFFEQLFVNLLGTVNAIMASRIGSDAVSAIGMVDSINSVVTALFSAMAIGGTVVVAQYVGRGDREQAGEAARQALAASALLAMGVAALCVLFRDPLLTVLYGHPGAVVQGYMHQYLLITALTYPLTALTLVASGALRGAGETRLAMQANTLMNVLNVFFGYMLIYGMHLQTEWFTVNIHSYGVVGAAMAISFARLAGALYIFVMLQRYSHLLPLRLRGFRFDFKLLRPVFAIGIPSSLEALAFSGGKLLVQVMLVGMGTAAIAANYIAFSIAELMNIPGRALAISVTTLVGHAMGRNDESAAERDLWYVLKLAWIAMFCIGMVCFPLAGRLVGLYTHDPLALTLGTTLVQLNCAFLVLYPTTFVLPYGFKGAGDARYTVMTTLIGMFVFRICLAYLFGIVLGWGVVGVWFGIVADWFVRSALYLHRLISGGWKGFRLLQH
jgi:putative MATE family efflux protein